MYILKGSFGLLVLLAIAVLFSSHKKSINWRLVISGVAMQLVLALLIFKVPGFDKAFEVMAASFTKLLSFTDQGAQFIFGKWPDVAQIFSVQNVDGTFKPVQFTVGYVFAFKVLPTIVFFSALTSLLYYLGVLQKIVYGFAWILSKTMRLSGAESLAAAANVFVGQTEAPLVVKPYIKGMTKSEILCLMTGGMATIAGGVFAAFIGLLGGDSIELQQMFAKHLLTASVLSAPAAIVFSKILLPEKEKVDKDLKIDKTKIGSGPLEAISNGTTEGIKLAVNVGGMILVFLAFIAMINYFLSDVVGHYTGLNNWVAANSNDTYSVFSLQMILGYLFAPIAWVIGIPWEDSVLAGQLLGEKTVINEFIAYISLGNMQANKMIVNTRTIVIMTYALCGFSNFASIGIQIGGIGTIAPNQRPTLAKLGMRALLGGTLACLMTAAVAGIFYG
ncbi:MAG: CNT family concentrative nucleoside transporter [Bacteroidia bacterium]|jgi:CNT family concentrative nucleoside transporter